MILMPQIFDVTSNENPHYKRNELEYNFNIFDQKLSPLQKIYSYKYTEIRKLI